MSSTNQKTDCSPHLIFPWHPWTQIPSPLPFSSPHLWVSLSRLSLPLTGFHCPPGHYVHYHYISGGVGGVSSLFCFCKCIKCSLPPRYIYCSSLWSCDTDTSLRRAGRGGVTFDRKTCSMKMSHLWKKKKKSKWFSPSSSSLVMMMVFPLPTWITKRKKKNQTDESDKHKRCFCVIILVKQEEANDGNTGGWRRGQQQINLLPVLHVCLMIRSVHLSSPRHTYTHPL